MRRLPTRRRRAPASCLETRDRSDATGGYGLRAYPEGVLLALIGLMAWLIPDPAWAAMIEGHTFGIPTTPIPEPSTMLLFGTGVVGLMGYRWRRKNTEDAMEYALLPRLRYIYPALIVAVLLLARAIFSGPFIPLARRRRRLPNRTTPVAKER